MAPPFMCLTSSLLYNTFSSDLSLKGSKQEYSFTGLFQASPINGASKSGIEFTTTIGGKTWVACFYRATNCQVNSLLDTLAVWSLSSSAGEHFPWLTQSLNILLPKFQR